MKLDRTSLAYYATHAAQILARRHARLAKRWEQRGYKLAHTDAFNKSPQAHRDALKIIRSLSRVRMPPNE